MSAHIWAIRERCQTRIRTAHCPQA